MQYGRNPAVPQQGNGRISQFYFPRTVTGKYILSRGCKGVPSALVKETMRTPQSGPSGVARLSIGHVIFSLLSALALCGPAAAQSTTPDLRGGGAFDTISIAGFLIPIDDIDRLDSAGILGFNPQTNRFAFADRITSERRLKAALRTVEIGNARAIRDLYRAAKVPLPNGVAHTLTVPSGFGPAIFSNQRGGLTLGVGIGGVSRVPYTNDADGGVAFGLSFGNSFETVGGTIGMSLNDLSDVSNTDRMSFGIEFSRYIADGLSISVGGENLFVVNTDGEESYYVTGSWAFDADSGMMPFDGVATIGLGSGRFANKTARDIAEGKGQHGTVIFGALAWEINPYVNLIADWNGRNLSMGGAFRIPKTGVSVKLGARDLTDNTGDGARLTGSIGFTIARF